MAEKHHYIVSVFGNPFKSLEDAKWNVKIAFTREEAKLYLTDESIAHFIGNRLHSVTPIHVDEYGNISFGRTRKFI